MKIWIDADACPKAIKEIIFKASERLKIETILVANQNIAKPRSLYIKSIVVDKGPDVADQYIVDEMDIEDLVITQDIPLADLVVTKGGVAINPRGDIYTEASIKEKLSIRDFMTELRDSGLTTGGPRSFNDQDKRSFASSFDKIINKKIRQMKLKEKKKNEQTSK